MSEEQLSALLAKLKDDAELREKFRGAADLDSAVEIARQAGFDVDHADWHQYQARVQELSDGEMENVSGGEQDLDCIICSCSLYLDQFSI